MDKAFVEKQLLQLEGELRKAEAQANQVAGAIKWAEFILAKLEEEEATTAPAPTAAEAPTAPATVVAPPAPTTPATSTLPAVPCEYCGAAITGKKFKRGELAYCSIVCADKAAQGVES